DTLNYDFIQKELSTSGTYDLLISPTGSGRYYFSVYGKNVPESTQFNLTASAGGTYISNIYPKRITNSTTALITLYGIGFQQGMTIELSKNESTVATAQSVFLSSSTMLVARFDLSEIELNTYDVVVRWPDGSTAVLPSKITVHQLKEGMLYEDAELTVAPGIPVTYTIAIPDVQNLFITLQKVQYPGDPHYNWWGTINISAQNGTVLQSRRGNQDQIIHIPTPEPGLYTISINSDSPGTGILTVWEALPELVPGEWVVDTIHRPFGSVFHQIFMPPGKDNLILNAQAMGDWSYFRVHYSQWGGGQYWISRNVNIPHPLSGLYIIEFMDSQMVAIENQTREVMIKADVVQTVEPPPVFYPYISDFSPLKGGNAGMITMEIKGAWLDPNAEITLTQNGIPATEALS